MCMVWEIELSFFRRKASCPQTTEVLIIYTIKINFIVYSKKFQVIMDFSVFFFMFYLFYFIF